MSKWKWILIVIVVVVIGYLLLSKVFPGVATGIDDAVGPSISGFGSWLYLSIVESWLWQSYGNYICFALGGVFIGLMFWQGHNAYNKVRGTMVRSATKEAYGLQREPIDQPIPLPSTPTAEPTPVKAEVEVKKEAT